MIKYIYYERNFVKNQVMPAAKGSQCYGTVATLNIAALRTKTVQSYHPIKLCHGSMANG
jgi:hypothetical protein